MKKSNEHELALILKKYLKFSKEFQEKEHAQPLGKRKRYYQNVLDSLLHYEVYSNRFSVADWTFKKLKAFPNEELAMFQQLNKIEQEELKEQYVFSELNKITVSLVAIIGVFVSIATLLAGKFELISKFFERNGLDFVNLIEGGAVVSLSIALLIILSAIITAYIIKPKLTRSKTIGLHIDIFLSYMKVDLNLVSSNGKEEMPNK